MMTLRMDNPGVAGLTADVEVGAITVGLVDTNGVGVPDPAQFIDAVRVSDGFGTVIGSQVWPNGSPTLALLFSPSASVVTNVSHDLTVIADIAASAPLGAYRLQLADTSFFDARDANSNSDIPVIYQTDPVDGNVVTIEAAADTLLALGTPAFPSTAMIGVADLQALQIRLRHPGVLGVGRIRADEVTIRCRNETRNPLVPGTYVVRIAVLEDSLEIGSLTSIPTSGDRMTIPISTVFLEPGETKQLEVRADISATAPQSMLELVIEPSDVVAASANTLANVVLAAEPGSILPLTSGLVRLLPPATELVVEMKSDMPAALLPGAANVRVARLEMENTAGSGSGPITIDYLVLRSADQDFNATSLGAAATRVVVMVGATPVGQSGTLTVDSTTAYVSFSPPVVVDPQASATLDVRIDCRSTVPDASMRVGVDSGDIGVVQPGGALLQIRVEPYPGQSVPMWTEAGSFNALSLDGSFSNFPNPFAAGNQATTFVYYLDSDATVSLTIWTLRGESVNRLRSTSMRTAGLYQDDVWDGRNERGRAVVNGVYIAELKVSYDNGGNERLLRKVAVVR
jgi:hypothetical protein